jgi:hypothetical protein
MPAQMDSRLHGNDEKTARCITSVAKTTLFDEPPHSYEAGANSRVGFFVCQQHPPLHETPLFSQFARL